MATASTKAKKKAPAGQGASKTRAARTGGAKPPAKAAAKSPAKPPKKAAAPKVAHKRTTRKTLDAVAKPQGTAKKAAKAPAAAVKSTKTAVKEAPKAAEARQKLPFAVGDHVVYPTHGVGKITAVEEQEISGMKLRLFVVEFDKDKMTLRVPVAKVATSGMRKLATAKVMEDAMTTLKGRARVKRTMWSRRAQEYEAKINSGDPISIAEVVRDLHRNANQPEQSYSERQIYEAALDRLVREVAAVEKIDEDAAQERLQKVLQAA